MLRSNYKAIFKPINSLDAGERLAMAHLYLTYYDNANEDMFFRDLDAKTEAVILYYENKLAGFSTLFLYDVEWLGQTVHIAYSGDTVVHKDHWGQQAIPAAWLRRIGRLSADNPSTPIYWFLLVKGHRTYRFLPSFVHEFYPCPGLKQPDLKLFADHLATKKFGKDYNLTTGVVEFKHSLGNLKETIAHPSERELKNPAVNFFLEKNPGYLKGHELVCLCRVASDNLKPFARRIFESEINPRPVKKGWETMTASARQIKKQPDPVRWLRDCLTRNAETEYGRRYNFRDIRDENEYRERVPLISYDEIASFIEEMAEGKSNILFTGKPVAFEKTGGSGGGEKIVPYSAESLNDFRNALLPWLGSLAEIYSLGTGRTYMAISPSLRAAKSTHSGIPIGLPDGAYLGDDVLTAFIELSAVPPEVGAITSFRDWQLATLYHLLRASDLELISVWSPTFLTGLLDGILERKSELISLLRSGRTQEDAKALLRLEAWDGTNTTCLWPRLKLVSCWVDGSSTPYAEALAKRIPQAAMQGKGLLLTEGVVTVPDADGRPVPVLNSGFFEFLDPKGRSRLYHELEDGEIYEVVMTTAGGLYRYRAGDSVRCEGYAGRLPVLRFAGRCGIFSDLVGEKLSDAFVAECLKSACLTGILTPIRFPKPKYLLLSEEDLNSDESARSKLTRLEDELCRNPQYAYARKMGQLLPLCAKHVPHLTRRYTEHAISNGRRLGDIKIPALCLDHKWTEKAANT